MSELFFVYILTNKSNEVLYIGVTSNLPQRIAEHRLGIKSGFASRYKTYHLVYFEPHDSIEAAITREKQMKKWYRKWKDELIEAKNPKWNDLYSTLF